MQEFRKPRPNQPNACESEITFLQPAAREAVLKEWVRDYFIFEHSDAEPGDDVFERYEEASSTAVDGLFSLFCDRDECHSKDALNKFLSSAKTEDDTAIISKLSGWMEELLNNLGAVHGMITVSEASPELIQEKASSYLQHVTSYNSSGRLMPSPWPLVKVVKYGTLSPPSRNILLTAEQDLFRLAYPLPRHCLGGFAGHIGHQSDAGASIATIP